MGISFGLVSGNMQLLKIEARRLFAGRQLLSIAAEVYLPYRDQVQRRRGKF